MAAGSGVEVGSLGVITAGVIPIVLVLVYQIYFRFGDQLLEIIGQNQFLEAAIGTGLLSAASWAIYAVAMTVADAMKARALCSVSIRSQDEGFKKLIDFIGKKGLARHGALTATTHKKKDTYQNWKRDELGHTAPSKMEFRPDDNNSIHVLCYNGSRILMRRSKGETVMTGYDRRPLVLETLTLSCWGLDNSPILLLVHDAMAASHAEETDDLTIYVQSNGWPSGFIKALSKKPRPLESVILDQNLATELISDAREFLASGQWYADVGIPYRRGYLLHGPPGCGKTSFCQALAGALKQDVCMLTLSDPSLNDNSLAENLREAPGNSIIMLEDVDAVFSDREAQGMTKRSGVTFSGLLNAIDGVASQEGRLFFMTTNHPEKLDPALVRPGRCDVKVELKRASRDMASRLFQRFFPDSDGADTFASRLPEYEMSMAQLQGYLLEYKGNGGGADAAVQNVPRLLRMSKPQSVDRQTVYEHLHRVGLDLWAPMFEARGYRFKADLRKVSLDTVRKWSLLLRCDEVASGRMGELLGNDEGLAADYERADLATVKDLFMATYLPLSETRNRDDDTPERSLSTSTASFEGLSRFLDEPADVLELSQLGDELCFVVQRDGKAAVSIWLLRRHLYIHIGRPRAAVAAAKSLLSALDRCPEQERTLDDLSTTAWLRRSCLEHLAPKFIAGGYTHASMLQNLDADKMTKLGITNVHELAVLTAVLTTDFDKRADAVLDFTSPDVIRLQELFQQRFHGSPTCADDASAFAWSLCDPLGRCPSLSIAQVRKFLEQSKTPHSCVATAAKLLLDQDDCAATATLPSMDESDVEPARFCELTEWLQPHGLDKYAKSIAQEGFLTLEDLRLAPQLECGDLEGIGLKNKRDARFVAKMIASLNPTSAAE